MKPQLTVLALSALLFSTACNDNPKEEQATSSDTSSQPIDAGLALLKGNCFNCHNPDADAAAKIAPTMGEIRAAYMEDGMSEADFTERISTFIHQPNEANSYMPEAVSKYGMMPKFTYKEEDLATMAAYIYKHDMSSEEWYTMWHNTKDLGTTATEMSYEDMGRSIAMGTKTQLGKNLMGALKKHGTPGAVTFCNTRAIPLTDSMAQVYNAYVKRVSDKPRNPDNQANEAELAYINELKAHKANGEPLAPKVTEADGKVIAYYAIETNKMCLQCHGYKDADILPETYANIHKFYPDDKATGYFENQVRGIWVITMDKK